MKNNKWVIISMCLWDWYVDKHWTFKLIHSIKQKDYLLYKYKLITSILWWHKPKIVEFNNNWYSGVRFQKSDKYYKNIRSWIYKDWKKTYPRRILNKLDERWTAIWYMDDWCLSKKKRNWKVHAYDLILNTYLSKEENENIIQYFYEERWVLFKLQKSKWKYRLRMWTKEARNFIDIIKPYIIPSMEYKIDIN